MCFGKIVITNLISAIRQIFVILDIYIRDVEDILIVTHFKSRKSVVYDVLFTFDIVKFRAELFEH